MLRLSGPNRLGYIFRCMNPEDHTAPPPPDSDIMLVQRTLAGEQRAFELLVIKYQRKLGRLLSRFIRDAAEVEDVAHGLAPGGLIVEPTLADDDEVGRHEGVG